MFRSTEKTPPMAERNILKVTVNGRVPEEIKKAADEQLEKLNQELETATIRLSILENDRNSDTDIYTQAVEDAKNLKTFADSIAKAEKADPDALRMVLMKHIARIDLTGDGKYIITPVFDSSSNITKWRPGRESNPRPTA